ncbi:MAG: hypothetical protein JWO28_3 [Hyphomicrobiales bacterium]|nr:hypothetical protein [Hyphomicrobiales bacterium]
MKTHFIVKIRQSMLAATPRAALLVCAVGLAACGSTPPVDSATYPTSRKEKIVAEGNKGSGGIFGRDGLVLFGKKGADTAANDMSVNAFLWRASLDTFSFMPLASADSFGGVIITDWYVVAEAPERRFKVTAYILDRELRADGIRVTLFEQRRDATGWTDIPADTHASTDLENTILTRARQLRIEQMGQH